MPDLVRTPGEIRTMINSIYLKIIDEWKPPFPKEFIKAFGLWLENEFKGEIFYLLCQEERLAVAKWLNIKREFILGQLANYYRFKNEEDYGKSDIIRAWLIEIGIKPEDYPEYLDNETKSKDITTTWRRDEKDNS